MGRESVVGTKIIDIAAQPPAPLERGQLFDARVIRSVARELREIASLLYLLNQG